MTLGEKIHQLRKGKGMSQEELALQLTVSRQAISKWELGDSVPDTENIVQLSKLFSVSTDYLLNEEYESDTDIPAVRTNSENMKTVYRGKVKKASVLLIGIGLVGILIMWILSSAIPARKTVLDHLGPPAAVESSSPENWEDVPSTQYHTTREVRGDLMAFLETFALVPIFTLCCLLVLTGIVMLLFALRKKKLQRQHR